MASKLDEFGLIERYFAPLAAGEPGAFGLTDDAAELAIAPGKRAVVATDALVAGVHFPETDEPQEIARRLVRVNLSDMAAMGARPRAYTVALALPGDTGPEWVAAFAEGLAEEQRRFGITLIGGDTTRSRGELMLSLTILGEVTENNIILRSGAAVDDDVYVTGTIGDSLLGRLLLEDRIAVRESDDRDYLVGRFRNPEPRLEVGLGLAGLASAAADISDGLVADLNHICQASGVAAELELALVPLSGPARRAVTDDQPLHINLLTGGDDYELVFTAPTGVSAQVQELAAQCGIGLTRIGKVTARGAEPNAVTVRDAEERCVEVGDGGYRHFRG